MELQCLLEDSSRHGAARLRDVFDILRGGLIVRYTGSNVVRMAATWGLTCGLLGLLIFGAVALAMPDRYQAETTLVGRVREPQDGSGYQPASKQKMFDVVNRATNDEALARLIGLYGLYGYEVVPDRPYRLGQDPARDIAVSAKVAEFRRDIHVAFFDPNNDHHPASQADGVVVVTYRSAAPGLVAQLANQIASLIGQESLKESAGTGSFRIVITSPARVPHKPYRPNRTAILLWGLACGAFVGITIALFRRRPMQLAS
jgi:hypothetical protein